MAFTRKDLASSVITGFYTGLIAWRILVFLKTPSFMDVSFAWLLVVVPILWILGVNLGYFLGRWLAFFNQFGKFSAIGFTNAAVDFGVLNLLIVWSGVASGILFTVFKSTSFILAVTHSYVWNKYWAFKSQDNEGGDNFFEFLIVNIIAAAINVGVASFIVNGVDPILNLDQNAWANIGAVIGSAVAVVFSFVGLKLIVFRIVSKSKNDNVIS